jgi:glycosyltransferase involved in cell wall biosynthesis
VPQLPLRRLFFGPPAAPDRVGLYTFWFRGHNNARYSELFPRLARLDYHLLTFTDQRLLRGLQYKTWRATHEAIDPLVFRAAGRRYRALLTTDPAQIALFPGPVVCDVDDPKYSPQELELLARPNVRAYVVTAERAARRYEELGLHTPWHVVPQGAGLSSVSAEQIAAVRAARRDVPLVVGYVAAWLLWEGDRGGTNPLYNVEHLLGLWKEIHERVPEAKLWLIGGASKRVRRLLAGRDDIVVFGRLPRDRSLAHVANFDIGLYPRAVDGGIRSAKIAEYLGFGVPTVSYDYEVTSELRDSGAGVLVATPREFVASVERLARDEDERRRLGAAALVAGRERDWDVLAARFAEILDERLPAGATATSPG